MLAFVFVAIGIAAFLAWLWRRTRHVASAVLAIVWTVYAGYEVLMYLRVLCSGECNIRIDLLLLYPLLGLCTVLVVAAAAWRAYRRRAVRGTGG